MKRGLGRNAALGLLALLTGVSCDQVRARPALGETAFDRVLRSDTLRVGYVSYSPGTIVDPREKSVTGIFPELLRRMAANAGLEVAFVEEATYATVIEGLQRGRYDIVGGLWANPNRAKAATLSAPVYFSPVEAWVRSGETRFDVSRSYEALNSSSVRIGAIDGSTPLGIIKAQFPKATLQSYPQLTQESQLFLDLKQGRIDVFFAEPFQAGLFLKANPGAIKLLRGPRPIRTFANVFLMPPNEPQMKVFVDNAILDLQTAGVVEDLLTRFERSPGEFLRTAVPYRRN